MKKRSILYYIYRRSTVSPVDSEDGSPSKRPKHDFFSMLNNNAGPQESELEKFLSEPVRETNTILKYPIVKKLFLRYNCALPASAAVERLFSQAGVIFKPTRTLLSDTMFEMLLFTKCNSSLSF